MDWADFVLVAKPEVRDVIEKMGEAAYAANLTVNEFEAACRIAVELLSSRAKDEPIGKPR